MVFWDNDGTPEPAMPERPQLPPEAEQRIHALIRRLFEERLEPPLQERVERSALGRHPWLWDLHGR